MRRPEVAGALGNTEFMTIEAWWPKLAPPAREWLTANNGDVVPAAIVEQIAEAGGPTTSDPWWTRDEEVSGLYMPDAATDWIEEVANGETPSPS